MEGSLNATYSYQEAKLMNVRHGYACLKMDVGNFESAFFGSREMNVGN